MNSKKTELLNLWVSKEQLNEFDKCWKSTPDCISRGQFLRKAVNAYVGKKLF